MQPSTKHAVSNPTLWINLSCLLSALIVTAMKDEWVKHYPLAIVILGIVNFSATAFLQYLRDLKKHPNSTEG